MALSQSKDAINKLRALNLQGRFKKSKLNLDLHKISEFQPIRSLPKFWLHYAIKTLQATPAKSSENLIESLNTSIKTRANWAYGIGYLIAGPDKEAEALYHGSLHAHPFWTEPVPPVNCASDADFLSLLQNTCDQLLENKQPTAAAPPLYALFFQSKQDLIAHQTDFNLDDVTKHMSGLTTSGTAVLSFKTDPSASRGARVVYYEGSFWTLVKTIGEAPAESGKRVTEDLGTLRNRLSENKTVKDAAIAKELNLTIVDSAGSIVQPTPDLVGSDDKFLLAPLYPQDMASLIQFITVFGKVMRADDIGVSILKMVATPAVLLNGPGSDDSFRNQKHFANIGLTFGVSEPQAHTAAQKCRVVAPMQMALMSQPGAARAMQDAMYSLSHKYGCQWLRILALRMTTFGVTPLMIVKSAILSFPHAPWSLFFNPDDLDLPVNPSLEELDINPPYGIYSQFIKLLSNWGIVAKDKSLDWDKLPESEQRAILQHGLRMVTPKRDDIPELKLQGTMFLIDFSNWIEDPLKMYTGVEGNSTKYGDLLYFSHQVLVARLPGTQLGRYKGASVEKCKLPLLMKDVLQRFLDISETLSAQFAALDRLTGPALAKLIMVPEDMTPEEVQMLEDEFHSREDKSSKQASTSKGAKKAAKPDAPPQA